MNDSKQVEQRAAYAALLMTLARQAPPEALSGLCDRMERTLAARTASPGRPGRRPSRALRPSTTACPRLLRRRVERREVQP